MNDYESNIRPDAWSCFNSYIPPLAIFETIETDQQRGTDRRIHQTE